MVCVIIFVTPQKYALEKVARQGPDGERVNRLLEFDYIANTRKDSSKVIAVCNVLIIQKKTRSEMYLEGNLRSTDICRNVL